MPTYITLKEVKKRWGHGQEDIFPVAQFEKLWVDMTALPEVRSAFVVVPRLRGQQLKDQAQLDGWLRDGSAATSRACASGRERSTHQARSRPLCSRRLMSRARRVQCWTGGGLTWSRRSAPGARGPCTASPVEFRARSGHEHERDFPRAHTTHRRRRDERYLHADAVRRMQHARQLQALAVVVWSGRDAPPRNVRAAPLIDPHRVPSLPRPYPRFCTSRTSGAACATISVARPPRTRPRGDRRGPAGGGGHRRGKG